MYISHSEKSQHGQHEPTEELKFTMGPLLSKERQIDLGLPRPEQHLNRRVSDRLKPVLPILRSTFALQLEIIFHHQVHEDDLGFHRRKEAARASMDTVPKNKVIRGRRDKLVFVLMTRLLPLLQEPVAVVGSRIRVDIVVFEGSGGDGNICALGKYGAVRKNYLSLNEAVQRSYPVLVLNSISNA